MAEKPSGGPGVRVVSQVAIEMRNAIVELAAGECSMTNGVDEIPQRSSHMERIVFDENEFVSFLVDGNKGDVAIYHRLNLQPPRKEQTSLPEFMPLAAGLTVITCGVAAPNVIRNLFSPALPTVKDQFDYGNDDWHQWCPIERLKLPNYVPDVAAGASAPLALTEWKIKAIKLAILLHERPVTRADFKHLQMSPTRWTAPVSGWLVPAPGARGYVAGPYLPDFKAQHPKAYDEILADKDIWAPKSLAMSPKQEAML